MNPPPVTLSRKPLGAPLAIVAIAVGYYVTGKLGLLLAIPPGYATAVWPPAGIALVGLLGFGYRAWPGVLLGSFAVNIATSFDGTSAALVTRSVLLAAAIGTGATLQAVAGAYLLRRYAGMPGPLDAERDVLRFMALGVASCLVAATIGVTSLTAAGLVKYDAYAFNWFTWCAGDSIGVMLFTPLLLMFAPGTNALQRQRRLVVGLPLALTFMLSVIMFLYVSGLERARIAHEFNTGARVQVRALRQALIEYDVILAGLASYFAASDYVSIDEFRTYVRPALVRHPGIQIVAWLPRVAPGEYARLESRMRATGFPAFRFTQYDALGKPRPASVREAGYPIIYVEPHAGNERAHGFDPWSLADRRATMVRARDSGEPAATAPLTLVQDVGYATGQAVLVFFPVYGSGTPDTPAARAAQLRGFVDIGLRIPDVVAAARADIAHDDEVLEISDAGAAPGAAPLFADEGAEALDSDRSSFGYTDTIAFGQRQWMIRIMPTARYLSQHRTWLPWATLTGALLLVGLLGSFLLILTGRLARIEALVGDRTRVLSETADQLRQSESRYLGLLDSAPDAIVSSNDRGEIAYCNPSAERMFGVAQTELIGQSLTVLMPDRFHAAHSAGMTRFLTTGESRIFSKPMALTGRRRNGEEFPLELSLAAWQAEGRRFVTGTIRDVTERRIAEQALADKSAELARSNQDLEQFAYVASHDLQEPLRMVTSYLGLLERRYHGRLDRDADDFIGFAVDGATRMHALIVDLLAYARIGSRGEPFAPTPVEQTLAQVRADLALAIAESGAVVTHDALPVVLADAAQLRQLFQNLISNAIKFRADAAPMVHVGASRDGANWCFTVRDNGIGIDPKYHERIFVIFQRLHGRDEYPGTGIGLALCKKIVEHHGGRIWVESAPGQGTTFYFTMTSHDAHQTT